MLRVLKLFLNRIFSKRKNRKKTMEHFYNTLSGPDWFNYKGLYSSMVREAPHKSHFVEVGSFRGRSSTFMAVEIINSGKDIRFDCVDHFQGSIEHINPQHVSYDKDVVEGRLLDIFKKNIEPVKDRVNVVSSDSVSSAKLYEDNSLDFVFIDADHTYESVIRDLGAWYPKIKLGGFIAGHDYHWEAVQMAVKDFFYDLNFKVLESECCWKLKKVHSTKRIGTISVGKYCQAESVFCINTKERPDRRAKIDQLIKERDLPIEFFEVSRHPNPIRGCAESHLKVVSLAKHRNLRRVMILEDDVEFSDKFWSTEFDLIRGFEIAHFGGIPIEVVGEDDRFIQGRICCAHAYLLNSPVFDQVLAHDCEENIDLFYSKNLNPELCLLTKGNYITQAPVISDADRLYKWANNEWETLDDNEPIYTQDIKTIPNILHFIHFGETEFHKFHLLAIKQAIRIQKPETVFLHLAEDAEENEYLKLAKSLCQVNIVSKPAFVNDKYIPWYQHKADITRLDVLYEFGGIYLDTDYFLVKPLTPFMGSYAAMCKLEAPPYHDTHENSPDQVHEGLFNGVIMAVKECEFIKEWRDSYDKEYGEIEDWWTGLSIAKPMQLATEKYPSVTILSKETFVPFTWEDYSVYEEEIDLGDSYGFHMWHTEFIKIDFMDKYLFPKDKKTTFSKLFEDPIL